MSDATLENSSSEGSDPASGWHEVLRLTAQMKCCARNEAWEELAELSQRRHHLVLQGFGDWENQVPSAALRRFIAEVRDLDEGILRVAEYSRNQLASRLERLETGKRALRAYHAG